MYTSFTYVYHVSRVFIVHNSDMSGESGHLIDIGDRSVCMYSGRRGVR